MVYSIWLRLEGVEFNAIQTAIDEFARSHGLSSFAAHVTLATGLSTLEEANEVYAKLKGVKTTSLTIDPVPFAVLDRLEWSTVVVLRVLSPVTEFCLPYPPHISLCYADASLDDRVKWSTEFAGMLELPQNIHAADLEIWDTSDVCSGKWFPIVEKFADIAVNLTDEMFAGMYHEKQRHADDRGDVISRSSALGCTRLLLLGGSVEDSEISRKLACTLDPSGYKILTTVGVHPTRAADFGDGHVHGIKALAQDARVAALGEMGLDAERLHFCSMDLQVHAFRAQVHIAKEIGRLPLLLHFRGSPCFNEFVKVLAEAPGLNGVVHSFTGTFKEMKVLISMGLSIGINGCSLREEAFLTQVLPFIPSDRLLFETDSPYCDIRPTHPSFKYLEKDSIPYQVVKPERWMQGCLVKGRNEPCLIKQVAQVVAAIHPAGQGIIKAAYLNTLRLFPRFR